jgi:hypothetical protein
MEKIEKKLIRVFGCHEELMEINGVKFWGILDSDNNYIGYVDYDEKAGIYHTRINSPSVYLDAKRQKNSEELKCYAEVRNSKNEVKTKKLVID